MARLLLLFVLVPLAEMILLIEIGKRIGTLATLGLIFFTGVLGAWLARRQGLAVLRKVQEETRAGRVPAGPLIDGVLILIAGAVLITPGVLTDLFGFLCLVPAARTALKRYLRERFERAVASGDVEVSVSAGGWAGGWPGGGPRSGQMRDVTPRAPERSAGELPGADAEDERPIH